MSHVCHAHGCSLPVPPRRLFCRRHWFALPQVVRDAVWREYRPGQEVDKRPSVRYLAVQRFAVARVAFRPRDEDAAVVSAGYMLEAEAYRRRAIELGEGDPLEGLAPPVGQESSRQMSFDTPRPISNEELSRLPDDFEAERDTAKVEPSPGRVLAKVVRLIIDEIAHERTVMIEVRRSGGAVESADVIVRQYVHGWLEWDRLLLRVSREQSALATSARVTIDATEYACVAGMSPTLRVISRQVRDGWNVRWRDAVEAIEELEAEEPRRREEAAQRLSERNRPPLPTSGSRTPPAGTPTAP